MWRPTLRPSSSTTCPAPRAKPAFACIVSIDQGAGAPAPNYWSNKTQAALLGRCDYDLTLELERLQPVAATYYKVESSQPTNTLFGRASFLQPGRGRDGARNGMWEYGSVRRLYWVVISWLFFLALVSSLHVQQAIKQHSVASKRHPFHHLNLKRR